MSTKKVDGLAWERLNKINLETYHYAEGMPNFSQFQTHSSQACGKANYPIV